MSDLEQTISLTHNISSAVFRVAGLIRHKVLRAELEASAVRLVGDFNASRADDLIRLVRLSESVGEMSIVNSQVLCRELGNLRGMMIAESNTSRKDLDDINIESMFSSPINKANDSGAKRQNVQAKDRQTAILQFIRQFPNDCRMKDLVVEFSDTSERTLRSDAQKLIADGLIERLGGKSGPFSYFRAFVAGGQGVDDENVSMESIMLPETTLQY